MGTDVLTRSATHVDTRACAHEHTRRLNGHSRISVENHLRMTRSGCVGGQQDVDMSLGGRREGGDTEPKLHDLDRQCAATVAELIHLMCCCEH